MTLIGLCDSESRSFTPNIVLPVAGDEEEWQHLSRLGHWVEAYTGKASAMRLMADSISIRNDSALATGQHSLTSALWVGQESDGPPFLVIRHLPEKVLVPTAGQKGFPHSLQFLGIGMFGSGIDETPPGVDTVL